MRELYGNSKYEPLKKDFWTAQEKDYSQAPKPEKEDDRFYDRKFRKAVNLQSSVLTHEDKDLREERTKQYGMDPQRLNMASNASWNCQNGYQKPVNAGKIDAYKMKQNQLNSQVLEQTDYAHYAPLGKKAVDMNNIYAKPEVTKSSPGKKVVDPSLSYANGNWTDTDVKGQIKKDYSQYDRKDMKHKQMVSALDDHGFGQAADPKDHGDEYAEKHSQYVPAKTANASIKQKNLASNFAGHDALRYYEKPADPVQTTVVDIDLSGLPPSCDDQTVKRVANVKHVISTDLQHDNLTGACKGEGRIKIRLNEEESLEQVRLNFLKAGYVVKNHTEDARKKPNLTGPPKDTGEHRFYNPKMKKEHELMTKFENKLA
uniref:Uncharacterized protein n=1 Tax=Strombidium inclinatum TaxID=197538 RepID=A0A7S3IEP1_9SPIT|mmetsp:Transcript_14535/g.22576  ORF Transcript_14535/g.22576 Transcript_14535/m.22576 type:complete len:372 (+) Transcript_14535:642-1757(+)